ncbi:Penicillin-binding protein 4* [compost metagenome]
MGDGGIYSNLNDLLKWDAALYTEKILPKATWDSAFSRKTLNNGTKIDYGYGWHLKNGEANQQVVYHTGSTTSFRNVIYRIPEKKFSLILLTNRSMPEEPNMVELAEKIISVVKNEN